MELLKMLLGLIPPDVTLRKMEMPMAGIRRHPDPMGRLGRHYRQEQLDSMTSSSLVADWPPAPPPLTEEEEASIQRVLNSQGYTYRPLPETNVRKSGIPSGTLLLP